MTHVALVTSVYVPAIIGWFVIWHLLVGYALLRRYRLLCVALIGCVFVLCANALLSSDAAIPSYATELQIYSYVEQNAKTVAGFGLAIAVFVLLKFDKEIGAMESSAACLFLSLVFWSFLFAVVGCLPLYWMPSTDGWLTALRHLKTVPYTYSLFVLSAAIIVFIHEMRVGLKRE